MQKGAIFNIIGMYKGLMNDTREAIMDDTDIYTSPIAVGACEVESSVGLAWRNMDGLSDAPAGRDRPIKTHYVPKTLEEFELLRTFDYNMLQDMGCRIWRHTGTVTLWLFPVEWYESIPEGMAVLTLCGDVVPFEAKKFPKDPRLGLLCIGFFQALN